MKRTNKDTKELMLDSNSLLDGIASDVEFTVAPAQDIPIDPKKVTVIGSAPGTSFGIPIPIRTKIELVGQWKTSQNGTFVGPTGYPDRQINGANVGAAIVMLQTFAIPLPPMEKHIYPEGGMEIPRSGFSTAISILCNDDNFLDNETNPADPIRAHLFFENK
ncbi:hypothetical protein RO575_22670 [Methylomonas sp. MO1]|uniref:hypothetical protein n=1 Tax=Methylomonas sp. MO1 TaxID=3073619 RepID=UPI0028A3E683|nr:hypothetical protein [Methylomonas sp. MO1]MDT4292379.1 hypothetical protein [Methylomonas sp. MO1]